MAFNIIIITALLFTAMILFVGFMTNKLYSKPKSNRLRKWWSKYVCDLDDLYSE